MNPTENVKVDSEHSHPIQIYIEGTLHVLSESYAKEIIDDLSWALEQLKISK